MTSIPLSLPPLYSQKVFLCANLDQVLGLGIQIPIGGLWQKNGSTLEEFKGLYGDSGSPYLGLKDASFEMLPLPWATEVRRARPFMPKSQAAHGKLS